MVAGTATFAELELQPSTKAALDKMGISVPSPIQAQAIPALMEGRDVVGQARTGSGKTLAFSIPLVERLDPSVRRVQALVLVPTRELAVQVATVIRDLAAPRGLKVTMLFGGRSYGPERTALAGGAQIVVGTPGRTLDHLRQERLSLTGVRFLVLDEADEMLDQGFARDVERIIAGTPQSRQTALFSATLPEWVAGTAARHLKQPVNVTVDSGEEQSTDIEHLVYDVHPSAKLGALRTLLDQRGDSPVLVFGRTKHGVKKLAERLGQLGYPAAALQGNLSQNQRQRVMHDFRSGAVPILLATNVAARGIDVAGIERVINYELPESAEWFTHRAGRTGRMGAKGEAVTFLTPEDEQKWRQIERALGHKLPRQRWPHEAPAGEVREPFVNFETAPREPRPRLRIAPRPVQRQAYGNGPRRDDRAPVQADRYERRERPAGPVGAPRRAFGARPVSQGQPFRASRPA